MGLQALIRLLKPWESNFCGGKYHSGLSNKIVVMVLLAVAGPTTSMETLIVLLQPLRVWHWFCFCFLHKLKRRSVKNDIPKFAFYGQLWKIPSHHWSHRISNFWQNWEHVRSNPRRQESFQANKQNCSACWNLSCSQSCLLYKVQTFEFLLVSFIYTCLPPAFRATTYIGLLTIPNFSNLCHQRVEAQEETK